MLSSGWGPGGRRFKSCLPDWTKAPLRRGFFVGWIRSRTPRLVPSVYRFDGTGRLDLRRIFGFLSATIRELSTPANRRLRGRSCVLTSSRADVPSADRQPQNLTGAGPTLPQRGSRGRPDPAGRQPNLRTVDCGVDLVSTPSARPAWAFGCVRRGGADGVRVAGPMRWPIRSGHRDGSSPGYQTGVIGTDSTGRTSRSSHVAAPRSLLSRLS